jgi:hypothetical protein
MNPNAYWGKLLHLISGCPTSRCLSLPLSRSLCRAHCHKLIVTVFVTFGTNVTWHNKRENQPLMQGTWCIVVTRKVSVKECRSSNVSGRFKFKKKKNWESIFFLFNMLFCFLTNSTLFLFWVKQVQSQRLHTDHNGSRGNLHPKMSPSSAIPFRMRHLLCDKARLSAKRFEHSNINCRIKRQNKFSINQSINQ